MVIGKTRMVRIVSAAVGALVAIGVVAAVVMIGDRSDEDNGAHKAAEAFARAIGAEDAEALCAHSALAGRPATESEATRTLCMEMLAPMHIKVPDDDRPAYVDPKIEVTVNGEEATAEVEGVGSSFELLEINENWLVVLG